MTPAQRWQRLSSVALPLALVLVVVTFVLRTQSPPDGPSAAAIETALADPCRLFTSGEMGSLVEAQIVERRRDQQPLLQRCSYIGDARSAGTFVEVGLSGPELRRRERGRLFGADDLLAEARDRASGAEPVADLGDEAYHLDVGVGEVWVRDGELVVSVAVARDSTSGDRVAARRVAEAVLAKVAALDASG